MTDDQAERIEFAGATEQLHEGFGKISAKLRANPGQVQKLSDRTLLALATWTAGTDDNTVPGVECMRRLGEAEEKVARFGIFASPPDPWAPEVAGN